MYIYTMRNLTVRYVAVFLVSCPAKSGVEPHTCSTDSAYTVNGVKRVHQYKLNMSGKVKMSFEENCWGNLRFILFLGSHIINCSASKGQRLNKMLSGTTPPPQLFDFV